MTKLNKNKNNKNKQNTPQRQNAKPRPRPNMVIRPVNAPVAYSATLGGSLPSFSGYQGGLRIRHSEYVGNLASTGTSLFSIAGQYPINPGMVSTFSWLSQIAANFEWYRFEKLRFYTRTLLPTSTTGGIYMTIDYDPADPAFLSKAAFMASPSAASGPLWSPLSVEFDQRNADAYKKRLVRILNDGVQTQSSVYDAGNLFVAYDNFSGSGVGDLMVEYDVVLYTPQANPNQALSDSTSILASITGAGLTNALVSQAGNRDLAQIVVDTTSLRGSLNFTEVGQYMITWALGGETAGAQVVPTWSISSGSGVISALEDSINAIEDFPDGLYMAAVNIYETNTVVRFLISAGIEGLLHNHIRISKYAYSLL